MFLPLLSYSRIPEPSFYLLKYLPLAGKPSTVTMAFGTGIITATIISLFRYITHRKLEHLKSSLAQVKEFRNDFNPIVSKVSQYIIAG